MSLSPENYRGLEVECRELIANTQLLLSGKDSQQHQQAAVFIEDDMSLSNALSEKYQECIIGGKMHKPLPYVKSIWLLQMN